MPEKALPNHDYETFNVLFDGNKVPRQRCFLISQ